MYGQYGAIYSLTIAAPEEVAETLFTSFLCGNAFSAPAALFLEDKANQNFDTKLTHQTRPHALQSIL